MTPAELMTLIDQLCEARETSTAHRIAAAYEHGSAEGDLRNRQKQVCDEVAAHRRRELERAIGAVFPQQATADGFMPVRPLDGGKVELRAIDTDSRPVAVVLTGTEALNIGARLTAHGAVALDRIGLKTDAELHALTAGPATDAIPAPAPAVLRSAIPARQH